MNKKKTPLELGRRERQIVETVVKLGEASVADVLKNLIDPPHLLIRAGNAGAVGREKVAEIPPRWKTLSLSPSGRQRKIATHCDRSIVGYVLCRVANRCAGGTS